MAKITRKTQKVFAGSASNNGQFGSAQVGTKVTSTDPDVIQQLAAWAAGWNSATISAQRLPTLEEMQGIQYVVTRQLAYVLQEGIPEWDTATSYYQNSIVKKTGTYELYGSLIDDNLGNALPNQVDNANWKYLGTLGVTANPISWGGTAGGTANALTIAPTTALAAYTAGGFIAFIPASNNTGAATINVSALGAKNITYNGTIALPANALVAGKVAFACYDGTRYQLLNADTFLQGANIAAAATLNLDTATGSVIDITGNTGITAITLAQGKVKFLRFTGTPTITNGASLVLPSSGNIAAIAGDYAIAIGYASGVVRLLYFRADGSPVNQLQGSNITAASTTTLDVAGDFFTITGNTTITSFGAASRAGIIKRLNFTGTPQLTHNGTSMILPNGGSNITVQAGDSLTAVSLGGSNWRVLSFTRASGLPLASSQLARAWVCWNGVGTVAILSSYNVTSVTDNGAGDFTVNFTTAMTNANYSSTFGVSNTVTNTTIVVSDEASPQTTSAIRIKVIGSNNGAFYDAAHNSVQIFGT